jgi:hypothetical protein
MKEYLFPFLSALVAALLAYLVKRVTRLVCDMSTKLDTIVTEIKRLRQDLKTKDKKAGDIIGD